MHKLLGLLLALFVTTGCDDPVVHEYFVSNFVCTYMPYWMGDCNSSEVADKAASLLEYGVIDAAVDCQVPNLPTVFVEPSTLSTVGSGHKLDFKSRLLADGTVFNSCSVYSTRSAVFLGAPPGVFALPDYTERNSEFVVKQQYLWNDDGNNTVTPQMTAECGIKDGMLELSTTGALQPYYVLTSLGLNPSLTMPVTYTLFSLDVSTYCTGRNLAAFGVEE